MVTKLKFTKTQLKSLPPVEQITQYQDTEIPSLRLRVYPAKSAGSQPTKTFFVYKKANGRVHRITLGRFTEMTVEQARKEAIHVINELVKGVDLNQMKREERAKGMTVADLYKLHMNIMNAKVKSGDRSQSTVRLWDGIYKCHLETPLGNKLVTKIDKPEAQRIINKFTQEKTNAVWGTSLIILKSIFTTAEKEGTIERNPFHGIAGPGYRPRERFLQPHEMKAFFEALLPEHPTVQDFVKILLFVGQRKGVTQAMTWEQLDLDKGVWYIPASRTKQKKAQAVPLSKPALEILKRRFTERTESPFVFYSTASKKGYIQDGRGPSSFWTRIITRAGLYSEDKEQRLTIHDLRRSLGSWQAIEGGDLLTISKSLGHSNVGITARAYAHLNIESVREQVDKTVSAFAQAANDEENSNDIDKQLALVIADLTLEEKRSLLIQLTNRATANELLGAQITSNPLKNKD